MDPAKTTVLCDLDGVVWLSHEPISGSVKAIAALRRACHRVLFVTNNSYSLVADQQAALANIGVPAIGDVLTSAQAAAMFISPGQRVHIAGGPGIVEAVLAQGGIVAEIGHREPVADVVLVGFHRSFDYEAMRLAARAVMGGATLIGTNDDATYPTSDGPIPGGGAILASIATACGVTPIIAGKPFEPMARLVRERIGVESAGRAIMVGDRPETDGRFAQTLGCQFALVWSGVTPRGAAVEPVPDYSGDDLASITRQILKP